MIKILIIQKFILIIQKIIKNSNIIIIIKIHWKIIKWIINQNLMKNIIIIKMIIIIIIIKF